MVKTLIYIIFIFNYVFAFSQSAFHNMGNIQIHNEGEIGFHVDVINDGTFNQNLGFAGFYNTNNLSISGSEIPRFYDAEVDVANSLFLEINTEIQNSLSYTNGLVETPRDFPNISLDFLQDAIYVFEDNNKHTDGYASYQGVNAFTYPIGDDNKLRPLIIPFQDNDTKFSAAYFNEDPNFPSTFIGSFNTTISEAIINNVSINEFWDFDGTVATTVTLTWNQESQIDDIVNGDLMNLRVVGWSVADNTWLDLGNTEITGAIASGTIRSEVFVPNDYSIITFGSLIGNDGLVIYNGISPNEDGENDTFYIEGIELFENNLKIYNRWGSIVFEAKNYQNDWNGISTNRDIIVNTNGKLPVGTYFYFLELPTENKKYSGWLYINY